MKTWWKCVAYRLPTPVECDAAGVYDAKESGGPAEKHGRETGHPTEGRDRPW